MVMFRCSAYYYWIDAKCLFCGKKMEDCYVLRKKEVSVIDVDIEYLKTNENKYNIVKEKYIKISQIHPDWNEQQIVSEINKQLKH